MFCDGFPDDFVWGAATASFQVEGHLEADGAGVSNWLDFCRRPGTVANGDLPDPGVSQYTLYREDVRLLKELGVKAYRFSVAWPRILPDGDGKINEKGLDHYRRLIDELLDNGIEPYLTIFHWDLPQVLEERFGGWRSKETSKRLGDYAGLLARRFSDRVGNFFTVNEPVCPAVGGYGIGTMPPGLKLEAKTVNQCLHNVYLAHGHALAALRANAVKPVRAGLVENCFAMVPVFGAAEQIAAARTAFRLENGARLTMVQEGRYPEETLLRMGADAPEYDDGELALIAGKTDFLGLNLYTPEYVAADDAAPHGYRKIAPPEKYPSMNGSWVKLGPEIVYYATRFADELWSVPAVYITENGCPGEDKVTREGKIFDMERVLYLRSHLLEAQRAVRENHPLKGYFVWSFLDNFEWADGFKTRFGIVHVDYRTLRRTPKLSAEFYREVIRQNRVI